MSEFVYFDTDERSMDEIANVLEGLDWTVSPPALTIFVLLNGNTRWDKYPPTQQNKASMNAWIAYQARGYLQKAARNAGLDKPEFNL